MKTTVSFCDFCDAFRSADRNENFSYEGKRALFDWLEQYEEETGTEQELDVVALCCDFSEMDAEDIAREYRVEVEEGDDVADVVEEYLNDNTMVIARLGDTFIFQVF